MGNRVDASLDSLTTPVGFPEVAETVSDQTADSLQDPPVAQHQADCAAQEARDALACQEYLADEASRAQAEDDAVLSAAQGLTFRPQQKAMRLTWLTRDIADGVGQHTMVLPLGPHAVTIRVHVAEVTIPAGWAGNGRLLTVGELPPELRDEPASSSDHPAYFDRPKGRGNPRPNLGDMCR